MLSTIETERLTFIPFSLPLKKVALHEKSRLAAMIGVRVPEQWPGPDFAEALPFFINRRRRPRTSSSGDECGVPSLKMLDLL